MTRVLVCGLCPLPFENTRQNYGPSIRTWQFARGLAMRGHEVRLLAMGIPGCYPGAIPENGIVEGVDVRRTPAEEFLHGAAVKREMREFAPEAVVGATIYGSLALARVEPAVPFWADQFGHVMAEAQAKAVLEAEDWPVAHWWKMVVPVARWADRISTVSERQRYALIGELGALGRLTAVNAGYEFTAVAPCALVDSERPRGAETLRGSVVPAESFVVLWSGGYNVWSDVETLAAGLETAMERDERIHFLSTGGAIDGHDGETYARFEELVEQSPHRDRFHLRGWVKREDVEAHVAAADLGVLTDRPLYEGMLGSKNRIVQWMAQGLPVAYNRQGDLGHDLAEDRTGLVFDIGDAAGLAERILWAADRPEELEAMASRARTVALDRYSIEATTEGLAAWAAEPELAPDRREGRVASSPFEHGPEAEPEVSRPRGRWARRVRRWLKGR